MKDFLGKFLKVFLIAALASALFGAAAFAADGDEPVEIYFESQSGSQPDLLGTAFFRAGALWVPAEALRVMGVPLEDGPNNKGFYLAALAPAQAFDSPALAQLAGPQIALYFPSLSVEGISYFNMSGMQNLVKLDFRREGGIVVFTPNNSAKGYVQSGVAKPAPISGKLTMVWEHVTLDNPNIGAQNAIPGLEVISPTWFNLMDANGGMANRASAAYVESAHRKGYRVWGLVSNSFNASMTSALFKNARAMNLFMARLIIYAKLYGLDGVNIDFEGMNETDRAQFVRFVARISELLRPEGLTLSVDVFIPANTKSSRSHDRGELAKYADYIMLMAYDEHWRTSPRAGSVASMPWVTKAVEGTLAEGVPASKLVLGVPFYMRRWEETKSGEGVKVKGYTLTMAEAEELSAKRVAPMQWLETQGQHYFTYVANGKVQKVWVENAASIERKLSLVGKYGLAGMAGWRKGHEKPEVWRTISSIMGK
ncbi:glycosyl hydrolase family 18 protein [Cloacibacillus evryensis]|uniref:glycosyl hydrolase family 18 protein n=1 Tax=Cloacibacillus evryensis TaxID=508460 RepID=UPI0004ADB03C|nr:glycosyl hydrolase family 18 protein [Cloacibacillus evryensis]